MVSTAYLWKQFSVKELQDRLETARHNRKLFEKRNNEKQVVESDIIISEIEREIKSR